MSEVGPSYFRLSKISIRIKLFIVVCASIAFAMSITTYATYALFKNDSLARVQQQILSHTIMTASRIELQFQSLERKIPFSTEETQDIFFAASARRNPEGRLILYDIRGKDALNRLNNAERTLNESTTSLARVFAGRPAVFNVTDSEIPLMAVVSPSSVSQEIRAIVIDSRKIVRRDESDGIAHTFLVNDEGHIVANPESAHLQDIVSSSILPIVMKMTTSPQDNEQLRYEVESKGYIGAFQKIPRYGLAVVSTIEEDRAFEGVGRIRRQSILLTLIILTFGTIVTVFFSRSMTDPIRTLVTAAKEIEQGNFEVELKPTTSDELGLLTHHVGLMAGGLKERERIRDAFRKFVNKDLASLAVSADFQPGGERRECTIFFIDLRNFTALCEQLEPEEVVALLNDYFREMIGWVVINGGTVDKLIGDAIMAHWGAIRQGNVAKDAEKAINAALVMRAMLILMNRDKDEARPNLYFGCGIATGDVIAGQIGSEVKLEFTVVGNAVNLAARLEPLNKHFGCDILISESTHSLVQEHFRFVEMPPIEVRGKEKLQRVFAVLGRLDDPESPSTLEELRDLIGLDHVS